MSGTSSMLLLYPAVLFHLHQNHGFAGLSQRLSLLLPAVFFEVAYGLGMSALSKGISLPCRTQEQKPSQFVLLGSGSEPHTRCWDFGTRDMGRGQCPSAELGMASGRCRTVTDRVIPVLFSWDISPSLLGCLKRAWTLSRLSQG